MHILVDLLSNAGALSIIVSFLPLSQGIVIMGTQGIFFNRPLLAASCRRYGWIGQTLALTERLNIQIRFEIHNIGLRLIFDENTMVRGV